MLEITLFHYLILALFLFTVGLTGIVISKNIIKTLICVEIVMSAININFIAFTSYKNYMFLSGMIFALFVTAISALQTAVGLLLIYFIYKNKDKVVPEEIEELKE